MKKSRRGLTKKGLQGLKRINNTSGERVFVYKGVEYKTLREVVVRNWADQLGIKL